MIKNNEYLLEKFTNLATMYKFAAVIPAYNEAQSIDKIVRHVISKNSLAIVVDDCSIDDTAAIARTAGAFVVSHQVNLGYNSAIETGLRAAIMLGCSFAVTIDADGQHDPNLLDYFRLELENGAGIVVGVRDRFQRWSESLFGIVGRTIWGLRDPLCGMKGYRLALLTGVDSLNTYDSIGTELAIRLIKAGVNVRQLIIKTRDRDGVSRFGNGILVNLHICRALVLGLINAPAFNQAEICRHKE